MVHKETEMTLVSPRTIIITPIQGKRPVSRAFLSYVTPTQSISSNSFSDSDDDDDQEFIETSGPRKRKRLTHLTPEQRMMRRKLKNRVAAQTARDRKKMRMQELEEAVAELEAENRRLQRENDALKAKSGNLSQQNVVLKETIGQPDARCGSTRSERSDPPESAALNPSQQQETGHSLRLSASQYLAFILTMSLTSLDFCSKLLKTQHQVIKESPALAALSEKLSSPVTSPVQRNDPTMAWWGPQQRSWNPSKN